MKDIANDLGLSVVTVSKVFRGHHDIGEETRQRVLARIKELNYQPNLAARSLATGRSYFMGLIVPDLMHPFFSEVAKHLASVIRSSGYTLLLSVSDENTSIEKSEVDYLLSRRVDVLLLASSMPGNATVPAVTESEVPVILIDRCFDGMNANFVGVDDELVGRIATQHLIDQDSKRIAIITAASSTGERRLAGYQQALQAAGLPVEPGLVAMREHGDDDACLRRQAGRRVLSQRPSRHGRHAGHSGSRLAHSAGYRCGQLRQRAIRQKPSCTAHLSGSKLQRHWRGGRQDGAGFGRQTGPPPTGGHA
jgi:LacI family transcriptional regulator